MNKKLKITASIIVIFLFGVIAFGSDEGSESSITLNASVRFTGTQFIITNNDTFDYVNTKLKVNDNYYISGYTLQAGHTYEVGIMNFADDNGNRFNLMKKPKNFIISCDLRNNDKYGWYYAEWR